MQIRQALLVFLRYPDPGRVKTRLARHIGFGPAASVYETLLRRTLGVVSDFKSLDRQTGVYLFHTPEDSVEKLKARFGGPWEFRTQQGADLGERMENALLYAFSTGARKAVLIGSDIADIEPGDLRDAFSRIGDDNTAVLGPAKDGGFYLIGLARQCRDPFRFEEWGSAVVFSRTRQALAACGFRIATVAVRSDIDLSEDLPLLRTDPLMGKSLSVIVPTLAGPEKLSSFLESLRDRLWPGDEIVLVEAGTSPNLSLRRLSKVVLHARAPRGRGIQQNIGAMIAKGDLLFFLHDDTVPPPEFPYLIRRACRQGASALGCFRLAFHPSNRLLELVAAWANLRSFLFKLPYGDQGFFCGRELFERVGGFRHKYLMEDVDFVKQCRRIGRLNMLDARVLSSSVRYLNKGILNASLQNHAIMILYLLGVCEKELYTIYYRSKSRPL